MKEGAKMKGFMKSSMLALLVALSLAGYLPAGQAGGTPVALAEDTTPSTQASATGEKPHKEKWAELRKLKEENPEKFKQLVEERKAKLKEKLETLKKENPEKYEELKEKIKHRRQERLQRLREENPEKFREVMENKRKKLEELKATDPQKYEQVLKNHPRLAEKMEHRREGKGDHSDRGVRDHGKGLGAGNGQGWRHKAGGSGGDRDKE